MLRENEEALKSLRNEMYEQLKSLKGDEYDKKFESINLTQARDGNSVLSVTLDGEEIRLNSAFRPKQEAERWAKQYELNSLSNTALLFGFGNGIFVRELLNKIQETDDLIVWEPSVQIFLAVLDKVDISDILSDDRVSIALEEINPLDFQFTLEEKTDWKNIQGTCFCEHPEYSRFFPEDYNNMVNTINNQWEMVLVNKNTDVHFAEARTRAILRNLCHIKDANMINQCIGRIPQDIPVIIVSAGPSLEKNIQYINRAKGKAFIFAVDSAVNALIDRGVYFDAMVSVDSGKRASHISRDECKNVPLFCEFDTQQEIMRFHKGKKIWMRAVDFVRDIFDEGGHHFGDINLGGSVANAAFAACFHMGFTTIILVGQDLAYDGEITHVGGEIKRIINEDNGIKEVEAALGGTVRTRYDWQLYLDWFEKMIKQMPQVEVIDATEGGALIHGSKVMKLQEAIEKYCHDEFDMQGFLNSLPPVWDSESYPKVHEKLCRFKKEIENLKRYAKDAIICCDIILSEIEKLGSSPSAYKQAKKLQQINEKMIQQRIYGLMEYYVTQDVADNFASLNKVTGENENDEKTTYTIAKAMYESFVTIPDRLADTIKETEDDLQRVISEVS